MTTTNMTPTERRLLAEIAEIRAELERRDIEMCKIEGAIEFLDRQRGKLLYVLASLIRHTVGTTNNTYGGKEMHDYLYCEPIEWLPGKYAASRMEFERPARRWTQFGTKEELLAKAKALGLKGVAGDKRQHLVERLWEVCGLPGSVAVDKAARAERLAKGDEWAAENAAKAKAS